MSEAELDFMDHSRADLIGKIRRLQSALDEARAAIAAETERCATEVRKFTQHHCNCSMCILLRKAISAICTGRPK